MLNLEEFRIGDPLEIKINSGSYTAACLSSSLRGLKETTLLVRVIHFMFADSYVPNTLTFTLYPDSDLVR